MCQFGRTAVVRFPQRLLVELVVSHCIDMCGVALVLKPVNRETDLILSRTCSMECDYRRGFRLDVGFIDHLCTHFGTTSNYSAIANLHTSQITIAHAKSFPACCVFSSRSLVTASSSGVSSAFALTSLLNGGSLPPVRNWLGCCSCLITPRHCPRRQHR
jgi:hypothetical protein